jgi:AmiR/NasT family two-component response regulator
MLRDRPVLIVQDNIYLAMDLSAAIEELSGRVVGPVSRVAEALAILEQDTVAAAVLDCELPDSDVRPLVKALTEKRVPFVVQTSNPVAAESEIIAPAAAVLVKPIRPSDVATLVGYEIARSEMR